MGASRGGQLQVAKVLLAIPGVNVNDQDKVDTFIFQAFFGIKIILKCFVFTNVWQDGSTALMCASENGHSEVVKLLLSRPDVDMHAKDKVNGLISYFHLSLL